MEFPVCSKCHDQISVDMAYINSDGDVACTECMEKMPEEQRLPFHRVNIRRLRERWRGIKQ
ncbi:MAG: hypothetical protein ACE5OP_01875 [Candidatus Glassbacteria bacterium]